MAAVASADSRSGIAGYDHRRGCGASARFARDESEQERVILSAAKERVSPSPSSGRLSRNVYALSAVSFFTDASSEMIYPLMPIFLTTTLGASAGFLGVIEGAAETTAALLKLASGWWSDRLKSRKPLIVAGYSLASFARPLIAVAQTAGHVLAIRVADRIGKGIRGAPRDALIADSVDVSVRGRAFGFHRGADHAGAVVGPLIAFAVLTWWHTPLRTVFWLAAIPGVIAVFVAIMFVREPAHPVIPKEQAPEPAAPLPGRFWGALGAVTVFTLGNSTDAFLLLRATQLGVPVALAPILWAMLHIVKSSASTPGGALSDRVGRKPAVIAGWVIYAVVYLAFARATEAWHAWALFAVYGVYFGLAEGPERAMVADIVPGGRRGLAYGWYNLAIGIAALPASVVFGLIWDRSGPAGAFTFGAAMAGLAALLLLLVPLAKVRPSAA
jgi:MFS family permease